MITKEDGLRFAKLVHVSVDNGLTAQSNKVYIMTEQVDGQIKCEYGRVGRNMTTVYKGKHEWDKIYKQKTSAKKGYKDITELIAEAVQEAEDTGGSTEAADIADKVVKQLFDELMAFANKSIQKNYKVTQDEVTQAQVDRAQEQLDEVIGKMKVGVNITQINQLLMELYTTIPRRMDNVKDYLLGEIKSQSDLDDSHEFLSGEQDTLDTMAGQVKLIKQQKGTATTDDEVSDDTQKEITLLEQMGLEVSVETDQKGIDLVHKLLGPNKHQAKRIFKCINKKTQKVFDANLKKMKNKKRRLYWHGSRNENWFNIIQTGLLIRPSGAIHTGSMFGDGIYFADKAQKSLGYSSLRGSYWSNGSSNKGFLALFDVHLGNQKEILHHNSSCYSLSQKVMDSEGYDSVFAKGGADLRNNEFIVYNGNRCTIAYIVEMQN
jgi:poly [ADP-ribose] polymerase